MTNPIEIEADGIYTRFEHYNRSYTTSPYLNMWNEVLKNVEGLVIDIGCGPGQFMDLCMESGISCYVGYDVSGVAIDKAKAIREAKHPDKSILLMKQDLLVNKKIIEGTTYVLCEILEHIKNDHDILALIPVGKKVIITLPNFLGGSHVRKFDANEEISDRFKEIKFEKFIECKRKNNTKITVCVGTKV